MARAEGQLYTDPIAAITTAIPRKGGQMASGSVARPCTSPEAYTPTQAFARERSVVRFGAARWLSAFLPHDSETRPVKSRISMLAACCVAALLASGLNPVGAEPLAVGLQTGVVATDNLFLSREKESGAIIQLLPSISGGQEGGRGTYRYYYGPSALIYSGGNSDLNSVFHVLQADGRVELFDEYLSLVVSARANQNLIDPAAGAAGFTAVDSPDAFAQTASLQVTPVIRFPIVRRDFATVELAPGINYTYTGATAEDAGEDSGFGSQGSLAITSGEYFPRMPWSINAYQNSFNEGDNQENEQGNDQGTSGIDGTLAYRITPRLAIQGLVGYDYGDYESTSSTEGWGWRITPVWAPSANTSVAVGYGGRYFGPDYYANISHIHKKTTLSFTYETVVANARTAILNTDVVNFEDPCYAPSDATTGAPGVVGIDPLTDQSAAGSVSNPALSGGVFVQSQMTGCVRHRFGRSTGYLYLLQNHWDYQASDLDVYQTQGSVVVDRALSPSANGSLGLAYWIYDQSISNEADFNQYQAWAQLSYQLSSRLSSSCRYSYFRQDANTTSQNFDGNSLWLALDWKL